MNYKYYIYKQATGNPYFDKYDFSQYDLLREINQNSKWSLNIERDNEWFYVIRKKFNGEITVKGTDFDALIALEETHIQYAIVIHRECNGVYTEFWKGFFSYFDFKVDLDGCYLTFEPTVWDNYSPIMDQMDIEQNALMASVPQTVLMDKPEFAYEAIGKYFWAQIPFGDELAPIATWTEYDASPEPNPDPNQYYLYQYLTLLVESTSNYTTTYNFYEYRRDIGFTTSGFTPPSGSGDWVVLLDGFGVPVEYSPGIYKWVRPYLGSNYTTYTYDNIGWLISQVLITDNYLSNKIVGLIGCITLKSVIEYFATFFKLTYVSQFFNDIPCPMGGTTLELTMLQQMSNLRVESEFAVKGKMKLSELLRAIRDTFDCNWFIDSNGDFRIEHRKWFEWGFSYTTYSHIIALDLTVSYPDNIRHLNRYVWDNKELYRFEILDFPYSYSTDWVDAELEYPQLSIINNQTNEIKVTWSTDIFSMYDVRNELSRYGWILLDCYQQYTPKAIKWVRNTIGAITNMNIQNGRFSSANLMRDLWKWGRLLPSGKINTVSFNFLSIIKLKEQVTLSIPQCCQDLDYNGNFRTELGDGIIDSAEYEQNGTLKVNLIYE